MDPEKAQIEMAMLNGEGQRHCVPVCPSEENPMVQNDTCVEITNGHLVSASLCTDPQYRKLAISSIICGISCIGIMSLIYSVQAREVTNREKSDMLSKKARRYGILSIVVWVTILIMLPVLVVLASYVLTLID
ncbi:unnamed protein product [Lota lota]